MEIKEDDTSIKYYDSIENLPIYNWDRYISSGDLNWFRKDFEFNKTRIHDQNLSKIEIKLLDEYYVAKNDNEFSLKLQRFAKIDNLKTIYNLVTSMIEVMMMSLTSEQVKMETENRFSYIELLSSFGLSIQKYNNEEGDKKELMRIDKEKESIKDEINKIENELLADGLDINIDLNRVGFEIIANDWLKNRKANQTNCLDEELKIVAHLLDNNTIIKPQEISLLKWVELSKKLKIKD